MEETVNNKQESGMLENVEDSELTVDATHQRFQHNVYICCACTNTFEKKYLLTDHFSSGCQSVCPKCRNPMYVKQNVNGHKSGHRCKAGSLCSDSRVKT